MLIIELRRDCLAVCGTSEKLGPGRYMSVELGKVGATSVQFWRDEETASREVRLMCSKPGRLLALVKEVIRRCHEKCRMAAGQAQKRTGTAKRPGSGTARGHTVSERSGMH